MMRQTILFGTTIIAALSLSCNSRQKSETSGQTRPNILFLLADDLGYGELGCYGQEIIKSPVLDDLAAKGVRFTDFYAGSAVCSPSRAVLMTGISSSISTIRGNKGLYEDGIWRRVALRKEEITIAEMLRDAGYQTAFIGKWHLDNPDDLSTWAFGRGFDYAIQEQWAGVDGRKKFTPSMEWVNGMQDSVFYDINKWNCKDEFRTELAFEYLDNVMQNDQPFFLFMSYRAPHGHERYISNKELYANRGWPEVERTHAAKITLLDKQIGRLLDKLEEMGELENTLVLFTSDNGPHHEGHDHEFFNSNRELRGFKRDLYEGGVRVPCIAYWKGRTEAGTVSGHVGSGQDFMPTIAEAAGVPVPEQSNGISFLPVLKGGKQEVHHHLSWEFRNPGAGETSFRQSVRIDSLKGVRYNIKKPLELYHLGSDISETKDVADQYPELVEQMNIIFREERTENSYYPYGID